MNRFTEIRMQLEELDQSLRERQSALNRVYEDVKDDVLEPPSNIIYRLLMGWWYTSFNSLVNFRQKYAILQTYRRQRQDLRKKVHTQDVRNRKALRHEQKMLDQDAGILRKVYERMNELARRR